ncbi:MAG: TIGR04283 family arsenosugar biosynthesis glycosyltransferase [Planctomycetota bacterium]
MKRRSKLGPDQISVIIPALNEAGNIAAAIDSCRQNDIGEIIVSDGGSEDATVEIASRAGAIVVPSRRGRGHQISIGIQSATRPILILLHADNRFSPGCTDALCDRYATSTAKLFWGGFCQRIDSGDMIYRLLERGNAARIRWRGMPFGDQAIFLESAALDVVGGMPEVALMEDVRLSQRLRKHSWPVLLGASIHVDARRWQKRGVIRQTLRNWGIQIADAAGVSEERLVKWYR